MEALGVAKYIIEECNSREIHISNLKLQKLLYYAQGISLAMYNRVIFNEAIVAWPYGPVVVEVYDAFKENGSLHIPDSIINTFAVENGKFQVVRRSCSTEVPSEEEKAVLNLVVDKLSRMTAIALMEKTHKESPWVDTYKNGAGKCGIISTNAIETYFRSSD